MGGGTGGLATPKFYLVKIHWTDGSMFSCEITQHHIDNFKKVATVAKVEVLEVIQ